MLLTPFLAICQPAIDLGTPPPPNERMVCEALPQAPQIGALQAFEAANGALVYLKADVDARDAKIAPYVVQLRGAWFSCSSQLEWIRDYYSG